MKQTFIQRRGFTLIEMMVSIALFSVVMAVATVALLSIVDASKKAHALQSVIFNLNTAIDGMVRSIRMGTGYRIVSGSAVSGSPSVTAGKILTYCPFGHSDCYGADTTYKVTLEWVDDSLNTNYRRIVKTYRPNNFASPVTLPITASEIKVTWAQFYITGTTAGDDVQPRVTLIFRGTAGTEKAKTTTNFDIQASATQRLIDI